MALDKEDYPTVSTVGEFVAELVTHLQDHPEIVDLPIAAHNTTTGLTHPIWKLDSADAEGLLIYINDDYERVSDPFRRTPDKFYLMHRLNQLLAEFSEELKKPKNSDYVWGMVRESAGSVRVTMKRMNRNE